MKPCWWLWRLGLGTFGAMAVAFAAAAQRPLDIETVALSVVAAILAMPLLLGAAFCIWLPLVLVLRFWRFLRGLVLRWR